LASGFHSEKANNEAMIDSKSRPDQFKIFTSFRVRAWSARGPDDSRRIGYLKFTLKVVGDICVMKLDGKFMAAGDSFFLREKIKNVLSMGIQKLLIDMDNVPYIDSTGVGFLVSSHTSITQDGGHLKLLKVKPKILEVFKLMNLLRIFEIFDEKLF
jgi:anti-anti-sigma factor